jgi:hypothetical protein
MTRRHGSLARTYTHITHKNTKKGLYRPNDQIFRSDDSTLLHFDSEIALIFKPIL